MRKLWPSWQVALSIAYSLSFHSYGSRKPTPLQGVEHGLFEVGDWEGESSLH